MLNKIKTYNNKTQINQNQFFILSKGLNAGKPMQTACPNCFVFNANNQSEKDFYYWLCFALWQAGKFQFYLVGSVIPFIRINDVKDLINQASIQANQNAIQFQKSLTLLLQIEQQTQNIKQQLVLLKQAKKAIVYKALK